LTFRQGLENIIFSLIHVLSFDDSITVGKSLSCLLDLAVWVSAIEGASWDTNVWKGGRRQGRRMEDEDGWTERGRREKGREEGGRREERGDGEGDGDGGRREDGERGGGRMDIWT
jgi:hypothetical protein